MGENIDELIVRLLAAFVCATGLLALFRPLAERFPERIEHTAILLNSEHFTRSLDIFFGVSLVYLSYQLIQRRLLAWWLSLVISVGLAGILIEDSHWLIATVIPLTAIGLLIITRRYFKARISIKPIRSGLMILAGSIALAILYGVAGFWLMDKRDFGINFSIVQSFTETIRSYVLIGTPNLFPHTRHAKWFLNSLGIMGGVSLSFGLYSLFRPIEYFLIAAPVERNRAEGLLEKYSRSSEDFFKLWPHDKSYFFSRDQKAVIAYAVNAGTALVAQDPAGRPESIQAIVGEFNQYCLINGWSPAYVYISEQNLKMYRQADLSILKVGEDAIINLKHFADSTATNKHFRNIANRFQKAGYSTVIHRPPHAHKLITQVAEVSREWAAQPDRQEWGFLAGRFSERYMQMTTLFVAYDTSSKAQAFVNIIPSYAPGTATIDLMRHRTDSPSNIMDYLFRELLLELKDDYDYFNLGLAPLSGLRMLNSRPEEKLLRIIYQSNQRFISFQGLRQFK